MKSCKILLKIRCFSSLGEKVVSFAFASWCEGVKRKISSNSNSLVKNYFKKKHDLTEIVANSLDLDFLAFISTVQSKHSSWGSKLQQPELSDD